MSGLTLQQKMLISKPFLRQYVAGSRLRYQKTGGADRKAREEADRKRDLSAKAARVIHKDEPEQPKSRIDFHAMKIVDLKKLAKEAGIKGYSMMNKATLVEYLNRHMNYS